MPIMEKKSHVFKAEIGEMLNLVVNSLYSKKEIFLRELVSNASDAIDRARFQGLTDAALVADNPKWQIDIVADKAAKTLAISDNGSGMDSGELEANLGTIAKSGTKAFREALAKDGGEGLPELIGQFGGVHGGGQGDGGLQKARRERGVCVGVRRDGDV